MYSFLIWISTASTPYRYIAADEDPELDMAHNPV